ncbi:MAG: cobalt transporter, partial [Planctomycetes bacterium]|nr:cobalt transporter [Planctomycetota bacterium]
GAGQFRFAAEVDFDGTYFGRKLEGFVDERAPGLDEAGARSAFAGEFGERVISLVAEEIDAIEAELRARYPELAYVDLEAD